MRNNGSEWPEVRIGDLGAIVTGRTPPTEQPLYFGQEFHFLTPGDMRQGKYARFTDRSLSRQGAELLRRIMIPAGSVCVSCIGWQMGETIMTSNECYTNQQINSIIPSKMVDSSFLYYSLRPRKAEFLSVASGTGVRTPILNKSAFSNFTVRLPPLSEQRRIASILSAYDNLIEVNRRRVSILEEMARRLFEEWFVHLRFPGHYTVPVHDTPDGPLPEGWSRRSISELSSYINRGIAPIYDSNSETFVVSQKCVRDGRLSLLRARPQSKIPPSAKLVQSGDILVNSTGAGTLGRVAQAETVPEGLTVDSHVTIVRPAPNTDPDFLGLGMHRLEAEFERLGTGSTNQTELNRSVLGSVAILSPHENLQRQFGRMVRPMRRSASTLLDTIERLAAARDLLLPRLVSGELSVARTPAPSHLLEAAD